MATLRVEVGAASYCPDCRQIYGRAEGRSKPCDCERSTGVDLLQPGSDWPTPFEICWYCQSEVVASGYRWAVLYCNRCHPLVVQLNDALDAQGLVSLPVGRHTLMHHWRHARPFVAMPIIQSWRDTRLDLAWASYSGGTEWTAFAAEVSKRRPALREDFASLAKRLQETTPDRILDLTRLANSILRDST